MAEIASLSQDTGQGYGMNAKRSAMLMPRDVGLRSLCSAYILYSLQSNMRHGLEGRLSIILTRAFRPGMSA